MKLLKSTARILTALSVMVSLIGQVSSGTVTAAESKNYYYEVKSLILNSNYNYNNFYDVNGDGVINVFDALRIQKENLKEENDMSITIKPGSISVNDEGTIKDVDLITGNSKEYIEQSVDKWMDENIDDIKNDLKSDVNEVKREMAVQEARMDQLVGTVPEGSADEIADARVTADGKTEANLGNAIRSQVSGLKETIAESKTDVMMLKMKNLFNSNDGISGALKYVAVGTEAETTPNNNMICVKIKIDIDNIAFTSIRNYYFVDENNIVLNALQYPQVTDKVVILKENIPTGAAYIWVSTYLDNIKTAQVEYGTSCTDYVPYGEKRIYVNGEDVYNEVVNRSEYDEFATSTMTLKNINLYNPDANVPGALKYVAVGTDAVVEPNASMVSQKIEINGEDIAFTSIRLYVFVNDNNKTLNVLQYPQVADKVVIHKDDIPAGASYLWVSTYHDNVNTAQVEYGTEVTKYEPYGKGRVYVDGKDVTDIFKSDNNAENTVAAALKLKSENANLTQEVDVLNSNLSSLYDLRNASEIQDEKTIEINEIKKQKLILNLHKRENDGFDEINDVYLPNAQDDFADIRIYDNNGKTLPYTTVYKHKSGDVISDSRIGVNLKGKVLVNTDGKWIACTEEGYMSYSSDRGRTWVEIENLKPFRNSIPVLITKSGAFLFSRGGKLYRCSQYNAYPSKEFDPTYETTTGNFILSTGAVQHPDGEIFISTYQFENHIRIYKSTDDGLTWNSCLDNRNYQHIHNLFIDTNQTPAAIYAGCDGGGGIFKSIDKGITWIDLKSSANIPQASDYGVIYSDSSGYRLVGGETSIVGGYSILKTTDDVNFKPVCNIGNSIYFVDKIGGKLYAIGCASTNYKNTVILVSSDEGETWSVIYNTAPLMHNTSASGGFRYITKIDDELIVGSQDTKIMPLRITGSGCFAEIIVDIPNNISSITVKTGYAVKNESVITNNTNIGNTAIYFPLNENEKYIAEKNTGNCFEGDYRWTTGGKHLSYLPSVLLASDVYSVVINSLKGFEINRTVNTSNGITISFWLRGSENTKIELINTGEYDLTLDGVRLTSKGNQVSAVHYPLVLGNVAKYDIVINADGTSKTYVNGVLGYTSPNSFNTILDSIASNGIVTVLKGINSNTADSLQHFAIREKAITSDEAYEEFNSSITDNH